MVMTFKLDVVRSGCSTKIKQPYLIIEKNGNNQREH